MEGKHMIKFLKLKFGLTDSGAKAVCKASIISFFTNLGYMALMIVAMYYANHILSGIQKSDWHYLTIVVSVVGLLYILVDREYICTFNATYQEATNLRLEVADRLKELPLSYFSKNDLSDLAQTIMQDVTDIEHAMSHAMPRCIAYLVFLIVTASLLLYSNWKLALAALLPITAGLLLMLLSQKLQIIWTEKYFWKTRETTEAFQETIELQKEIKTCGFENENLKAISASLEAAEKIRLKAELSQALPILLSNLVMKLGIAVVSIVSAIMLKAHVVQLVAVIGFVLVSVRLVDAAAVLEEYFAELFYLNARIKRINELRNTTIQTGEDVELNTFDIELSKVEFAYNNDLKVINGTSFVANQGQVTAIVGPSGCGKSTILRLISRLYDYQNGSILIDGHDIRNISTNSLFDKVSFVFQDVVLFNASVLDNIRMGKPEATDEEVKKAAKMANCEDFIRKLPNGYETVIGENGGKLSGGERQRISIARALLKNAPILLLDEISSSLDVENEREIQDAITRLIGGKTVIIVSHRLKSIQKADKIVVMDDGKVSAIGKHEELIRNCRLYKNLAEKSELAENFSY